MTIEGAAFSDDSTILNDEILYRRISSRFVNWAKMVGVNPKIPSQGFQDQPAEVARERFGLPGPCMSVDLGLLVADAGVQLDHLLDGFEGDGLVSLVAGDVRTLEGSRGEKWGQGIARDPREGKPWHAVVFVIGGGKKTSGMQSALSRVASWVIVPRRPADV